MRKKGTKEEAERGASAALKEVLAMRRPLHEMPDKTEAVVSTALKKHGIEFLSSELAPEGPGVGLRYEQRGGLSILVGIWVWGLFNGHPLYVREVASLEDVLKDQAETPQEAGEFR